jgi:hypothetical protein
MLQTASRQDMTQASVTSRQMEPGLSRQTCHMNYKRIDKKTDIAKTLCARDYKGFGTGFDTMNGVIEVVEEKNGS